MIFFQCNHKPILPKRIFFWPNPSSIRLWRTGVQCHGMWAHNLESFSFRKIFLNKTTERGIEPSTFRVEISKLNQDVPTELPRPQN